jgi:hypothetical protein
MIEAQKLLLMTFDACRWFKVHQARFDCEIASTLPRLNRVDAEALSDVWEAFLSYGSLPRYAWLEVCRDMRQTIMPYARKRHWLGALCWVYLRENPHLITEWSRLHYAVTGGEVLFLI